MALIRKHIEIVRSNTKDLSSLSSTSCQAIYGLLKRHYTKVTVAVVNTAEDLEGVVHRHPDLVFMGMKYVPDAANKLWLAAYFDEHSIAYTGSNHLAHQLELNKDQAKQMIQEAGLATAPFYVTTPENLSEEREVTLSYPLFVKPTDRGGGQGVDSNSLVHTALQLQSKVESINAVCHSRALVEEYLPGREFSVAILKDKHSSACTAMPLELVAPEVIPGVRMLSAQVKSADQEMVSTIADPALREQLGTFALDAFHALGARDYGRIDIRLDKNGVPHFLEANLIPSLIENYGSFPKACFLNLGMDYQAMLLHIVHLGLARADYPVEAPDIEHTSLFTPALPLEAVQ